MKLFRRRKPIVITDTGLPKVAVMGALRSGTNLVKDMLEENWHLSAAFSDYGWKHAGVPIFSAGTDLKYPRTPIVFVIKNPYAFVVSLHRYRMLEITKNHKISLQGAQDFDDFLRKPIVLHDSQLQQSPQLRFSNPLQYWNFLYWNLQKLDAQKFSVLGLNYEYLIARPDDLSKIEKIVSVDRTTTGPIRLPQKNMQRQTDQSNKQPKSNTQSEFDLGYYTEQRYLKVYSDAQLAFIRQEIDPWIMAQRGYDLI